MHTTIDIETWKRRAAFHFFRNFDDPFFNVCANLDVTRLYAFCKKNDLPFSLACLFFSTQTANEIEEFRLRLVKGEVLLYDVIYPSATLLHDDETFTFCYFEMMPDVFSFVAAGRLRVEEQHRTRALDPRDSEHDMIHFSVTPWVSFTSVKHPRRFGKQDAIPKMVFGKMFEENGLRKIPLSVEVHHAMMDGLHVGKFFNLLQEKLNSVGS